LKVRANKYHNVDWTFHKIYKKVNGEITQNRRIP
jgi:hypothetical protein